MFDNNLDREQKTFLFIALRTTLVCEVRTSCNRRLQGLLLNFHPNELFASVHTISHTSSLYTQTDSETGFTHTHRQASKVFFYNVPAAGSL